MSERTGSAEPIRSLPPRADDPTAELANNRLLASWGRDSRELQLVLTIGGELSDRHHAGTEGQAATLLGRLQADIHADRPAPGQPLPDADDERLLLAEDDDSVRIHACHGRARQVEVLREAILHRLADDPTLEPRDVIVMCPDIETFAPLIEATFGASGATRVTSISGSASPTARCAAPPRSSRRRAPAGARPSRVTASEVLDLADTAPVRRRFGSTTTSSRRSVLGRRRPHPLGPRRSPPPRFKLTRSMPAPGRRGSTAAARRRDRRSRPTPVRGALPLVRSTERQIELAGRFSEFIDRLDAALDALAQPQPVGAWAQALAAAADTLTATAERDAWQRRQLDRILDEISRGGRRKRGTDAPRAPSAARPPPRGTPDPGQLPQRTPDLLHARADALGAASRRLPARPR